MKTGRCTSSPLSTSSRKAASAGTNSRRLSTAISPTRTSYLCKPTHGPGSGVDYSTPFVIGTQSKSDFRTDGRWFEGYVAEFRYYFQVLDQDELNAIQDELLDKYVGRFKVSERAKLTADDGAADDRVRLQRVDRRRHDGDRGAIETTTRETTAGPRTCSRATRPATSPPTGRRLPS